MSQQDKKNPLQDIRKIRIPKSPGDFSMRPKTDVFVRLLERIDKEIEHCNKTDAKKYWENAFELRKCKRLIITALLKYANELETRANKIPMFCKANKNIRNYTGINKKEVLLEIANEIRMCVEQCGGSLKAQQHPTLLRKDGGSCK